MCVPSDLCAHVGHTERRESYGNTRTRCGSNLSPPHCEFVVFGSLADPGASRAIPSTVQVRESARGTAAPRPWTRPSRPPRTRNRSSKRCRTCKRRRRLAAPPQPRRRLPVRHPSRKIPTRKSHCKPAPRQARGGRVLCRVHARARAHAHDGLSRAPPYVPFGGLEATLASKLGCPQELRNPRFLSSVTPTAQISKLLFPK